MRNVPKEIRLRFRHPDKLPMKRVWVNGKNSEEFSAEKEIIYIRQIGDGNIEVTAEY